MQRCFFHVRDSQGFAEDDEGQELADLDEARLVAIRGARSLMGAEVANGSLDLRSRIEIVDEQGQLLLSLCYCEAITITTGNPADQTGRGCT